MPPLASGLLLSPLVARDINISNGTTSQAVAQVVCAWPVSGQYGFGTRLVYYLMVAACVLARRNEGLRNACLAGALLLPAVAAIHAVVLAIVHVDTAVDMDIYGAFQICSIGILAAPLTVYNSTTYFNDPGRNIIFLWTGLLLAGMLSLAIEFFRINTHGCPIDNMGNPIDPFNLAAFPYSNATCNLQCYYGPGGPFSPIRQDPTNTAAVIPAPNILSFGAATLLAAGSSIPPVLTLIFTWEKILEINWTRRFAQEEVEDNGPIQGTNGATPKMITVINSVIRVFLSSLHIPIFTGVVIAILVWGEINFWSEQVEFQTEPFSSVGQWANVVATVFVIPGSMFYFQKEQGVHGKEDTSSNHSLDPQPRHSMESNTTEQESLSSRTTSAPRRLKDKHIENITTTPEPIYHSILNNHRNKIATRLKQISEYLGTPAANRYDISEFRRMQGEFPEIPGEAGRVPNLKQIQDSFRNSRRVEEAVGVTPGIFRVNSFQSSIYHSDGGRGSRRVSSTLSHKSSSRDLDGVTTNPASGPSQRQRRDTLSVPGQERPIHLHMRPRNGSSSSTTSPVTILDTDKSPKIVVSAEVEDTPPDSTNPDTSPPPPT